MRGHSKNQNGAKGKRPPTLQHPPPKASGSLTAPQHWAGGGCSAQAPPPHSRPRVAMGTARLPGRPPPAGPPSITAVAPVGWGGVREGLSCAPVLVTMRRQSGDGRDRGMEVVFLGRLRTLSLMLAGYSPDFRPLWLGDSRLVEDTDCLVSIGPPATQLSLCPA